MQIKGFPTQILLLVFMLSFSLIGCAKKDIPLPDHPGGQLYSGLKRGDIRCSKFHGSQGEGKSRAPALVVQGEAIDAEKFTTTVLKGRGRMPRFEGTLTKEEIAQIIDWLEKVPPL